MPEVQEDKEPYLEGQQMPKPEPFTPMTKVTGVAKQQMDDGPDNVPV